MMTPWTFLFVGYALSVMVECPVLLIGLDGDHKGGRAEREEASRCLRAAPCRYPTG